MRMWLAITAVGLPCLAHAQSRNDEIAIALSAAPPAIAAHATVYVLDRTTYVKARGGSNGFTCLVLRTHPRTHPDEKGPVCYDPEGSRDVAPRVMAEVRMQVAGMPETEIRSVIQRGLRNGTYHVPAHAGIAYMLSPHAVGRFPGSDSLAPIEPHVMIYAPYLRNADIAGALPTPGQHVAMPFVLDEGEFNAYIIIPMARPGD